MRKILLEILFSVILISGCRWEKSIPVVEVFGKKLERSDIEKIIPKGSSEQDSILMAHNYIKNWITRQLMLNKAMENLSVEEKDIEHKVEEYRTSLLIHKYKNKLIEQKFSLEVAEDSVKAYYDKYKDSFILQNDVVRAVFFVIHKSVSNVEKIERLFYSIKEEDQEELKDYCYTVARKYDEFDDSWVEVAKIVFLMPDNRKDLKNRIMTSKEIKSEDEDNYYYLKIKDLKKAGEIAPFEYVYSEILLILENKKRLKAENALEEMVNEEAMRNRYVKYF